MGTAGSCSRRMIALSLPPDALTPRLPVEIGLDRSTSFEAFSEQLFFDLDLESRLAVICNFCVPAHAQWLLITLLEQPSEIARIASFAHRDSERASALRAQLRGKAYGPQERAFWSDGAPEVAFVMRAGAQVVGTLHVGLTSDAKADVAFYDRLAACCAVALRNAQRFEAQRRISLTFQNAALATALPQLRGFHFDALYEAGSAEALVGGDWYDAFQIEDGRIVLSIGDVAGSGLAAAVTMMNVRQAIRGVAQVHPDPAVMLAAAERTLQVQDKGQIVTAFVGVVDPITRHLSYANAGHPPPLLRESDGGIRALSERRLPLGLAQFGAAFKVAHVPLQAQSLLALYTDGLIESTRDILGAYERLQAVIASSNILSFGNVARAIHDAMLSKRSQDDVAIMTMRVDMETEVARWRFDPIWNDAATRVRREIAHELEVAGYSPERVVDFEIIFSELMSNVIRYAEGTVEVVLEHQFEQFILHALDKGPGFLFMPKLPPDLFSEFGRGLFLLAHLALDFSVEPRPGGGSHARVVISKQNGGS